MTDIPDKAGTSGAEAAWQAWYKPERDIGRYMATSRYDQMHGAFLAGAAAERERLFTAIRRKVPLSRSWRGEALDLIYEVWRETGE